MIKTIGHSNHPIGRFVDLLKSGGVEAVVDVRSTPYSRRFPQFGRERLAQSLSAAGILYRYEGAAWATLVTEGAYFFLGAVALTVFGHRVGWLALVLRPALAAAVFAAVLWAARGLPLLAASLLACAAFAGATVALRIWDRQERALILEMLRLGAPQPEPLA